ncbi:MAG: hypothetical protein ACFFG0_08055 [Candidatus Thorarchaeota archaeon]
MLEIKIESKVFCYVGHDPDQIEMEEEMRNDIGIWYRCPKCGNKVWIKLIIKM